MRGDSLGDRMKANYENRTRYSLPRRTCTLIRVDGKAFHSYTRGCARPYDVDLMSAMDAAMQGLCESMQGVCLGYVQSDEISVLLSDFEETKTEAWFDGNVQKIASISASIATAYFMEARRAQGYERLAFFDSRAFTIPDAREVEEYFIWRQQDATRNSISMTAQAHFSHKELAGKSGSDMQEMLWSRCGVNWNDMPGPFKRGRCCVRRQVTRTAEFVDKRTGRTVVKPDVVRNVWEIEAPPVFTQDRGWLRGFIPART